MTVEPMAYPTDESSAPQPEFEVLGARAVRYAAAPVLNFDLQVTEPTG